MDHSRFNHIFQDNGTNPLNAPDFSPRDFSPASSPRNLQSYGTIPLEQQCRKQSAAVASNATGCTVKKDLRKSLPGSPLISQGNSSFTFSSKSKRLTSNLIDITELQDVAPPEPAIIAERSIRRVQMDDGIISLRTLIILMSAALVLCTAAVCIFFATSTAQDALDTAQEIGIAARDQCFYSAERNIGDMADQLTYNMAVSICAHIHNLLYTAERLSSSTAKWLQAAQCKTILDWDWLSTVFRSLVANTANNWISELSSIGITTRSGQILFMIQDDDTITNGTGMPQALEWDGTTNMVPVIGNRNDSGHIVQVETPIPFLRPTTLPTYTFPYATILDSKWRWTPIFYVSSYLGLAYVSKIECPGAPDGGRVIDPLFGELAFGTSVASFMTAIDTRQISVFLTRVAQSINGSFVYIVSKSKLENEVLVGTSRGAMITMEEKWDPVLQMKREVPSSMKVPDSHPLVGNSWAFVRSLPLSNRTKGMPWSFNNTDYFILPKMITHETGINWTIVILITRDSIYAEIDKVSQATRQNIDERFSTAEQDRDESFRTMYILTGVISFLLVGVSVIFTNQVINAVRKLERNMRNVAEMDLDIGQLKMSAINEIRWMQISFQSMVDHLTEFRKYLPETVLLEEDVNFVLDDIEAETKASSPACSDNASMQSDRMSPNHRTDQTAPTIVLPNAVSQHRNSKQRINEEEADGSMLQRTSRKDLLKRRSMSTAHGSDESEKEKKKVTKVTTTIHRLKDMDLRCRKCSLIKAEADLGYSQVENMPPSAAADLFAIMLDSLKLYEGIAISISGTSLISVWNTFQANPQHAYQAASCALDMAAKFCNSRIAATIAINTGLVRYGNVGGVANDIRRPVIIGTPITQLDDLLRLGKKITTRVVCTERHYDAIRSRVVARVVDCFGTPHQGLDIEEKLCVYELLSVRQEQPVPLFALWNEGFSALRNGNHQLAIQKFTDYLSRDEDYQAFRLLKIALYFQSTHSLGKYFRRFLGWEDFEGMSAQVVLPPGIEEIHPSRYLPSFSRRSSRCSGEAAQLLRLEIEQSQKKKEGVLSPSMLSTNRLVRGEIKAQPLRDRKGHLWRCSGKMLGEGAFGKVWLGMGHDGQLVAIKAMRLPSEETCHRRRGPPLHQQIEDLVQEVGFLARLKHENIVSYLSSMVHANTIYICMEYMPGGTLHDILDFFGKLDEGSVKRYLNDVLTGLQFLHKQDIVHRDIKPHNVLLQVDGQCKLTDFGASALVSALSGAKGPIGTPHYMSPEACLGKAGAPADMWAIGIMFLQLVSGKIPYEVPEPFVAFEFIFKLGRTESFGPVFPDGLSAAGMSFAQACLNRSEERRLSATELLAHEFLL
eukprot:Sspe_Gene.45725::Locus_22711_Transcript_1_1_Confidence_1.000_Length_4337::g.45725::m.45725